MSIKNAGKFISFTFDDFCTSLGIDVQYLISHIHFQNGLIEVVIKHLQLIARSLLMHSQLLVSAWGHVTLHTIIQFGPPAFNTFSPYQMNSDIPPNLSDLLSFGCQVMVPMTLPKTDRDRTLAPIRDICRIWFYVNNSLFRADDTN